MADNPTKGPGDSSTIVLSESMNRLAKGWKDLRLEVEPATKSLNNFERDAGLVGEEHKTLIQRLKEKQEELRKGVQKWGTVRHQFVDLSRSTRNFMGELQQLASVQGYYKHRLIELRTAQDAYVTSANFSSKSYGKLDKYIAGVNSAYKHSTRLMAQYSVRMEESDKLVGEVTARFGTQIDSLGSIKANIETLMETSLVLSKIMGIGTSDALDYMQLRLNTYGRTLHEMVSETQALAVVMDDYTKNLQKQAKHSITTGAILRKDVYEMIKKTNRLFKIGQFDALNYAKKLTPFLVAAHGQATPEEIKAMAEGFGKFLKSFSDSTTLHPIAIDAVTHLANNLTSIADEKIQKRIAGINKRWQGKGVASGDMTAYKAREMLDAVRGSAVLNDQLIEQFNKQFLSSVTRTHTLSTLGMTHFESAILQAQLKPAGAIGKASKAAVGAAKDRKDDKEKYKTLQDAVKKGSEPTDPAYRVALGTYKTMHKLRNYLKWSQGAIITTLVAQAAGKALGLAFDVGGAALGRSGRALGAARAARAGGIARGVGTGAAVALPLISMLGGAGALSAPSEADLEKGANKAAQNMGGSSGGASDEAAQKNASASKGISQAYQAQKTEIDDIGNKYKGYADKDAKTVADLNKTMGNARKLQGQAATLQNRMPKGSGKRGGEGKFKQKVAALQGATSAQLTAMWAFVQAEGGSAASLKRFNRVRAQLIKTLGKNIELEKRMLRGNKPQEEPKTRDFGLGDARDASGISPHSMPFQNNLPGVGTARVSADPMTNKLKRAAGEGKVKGASLGKGNVSKVLQDAAPGGSQLSQWANTTTGIGTSTKKPTKDFMGKLGQDAQAKPNIKLVNKKGGSSMEMSEGKNGKWKLKMRGKVAFTFDALTAYVHKQIGEMTPFDTLF